MGTDLCVYKDGEYVSGLGRVYYYEIDNHLTLDGNEIQVEIEKLQADIKIKLDLLAAFSPKDVAELYRMVEDISDEVEFWSDELMKLGKLSMLAYMIEDDGVTVEPDNIKRLSKGGN